MIEDSNPISFTKSFNPLIEHRKLVRHSNEQLESSSRSCPIAKGELIREPVAAGSSNNPFKTMCDIIQNVGSVTWLWKGWIPMGNLTIVAAHPGVGKSAFVLGSIAKAITDGTEFLDNTVSEHSGEILWCDTESFAVGNSTRIQEWGMAPEKILIFGQEEDLYESFNLTDVSHLERLELIVQQRNIKLVVVDALRNAFSGDENCSSKTSQALKPLADFAQKFDIAIVLIHHLTKQIAGDNTSSPSLRGSSAIKGMARSVIHLSKSTDEDDTIRVECNKCNLGIKPDDLAFQITSDGVVKVELPNEIAVRSERERAQKFIAELLAIEPILSKEILIKAEESRISKKTLERAKQDLGVVSRRKGTSSYWMFPSQVSAFKGHISEECS